MIKLQTKMTVIKTIQKAILLVLWLMISGSVHAAQVDGKPAQPAVFALDDLYRLAMERSESIRIAENQLYVAQKDVDRAFSVLIPDLSAFGDYIRYNKEGLTQPKSGQDYGVKLQQNFKMNGMEFIALDAAKDTVRQREYDLDAVTEETLFTVASAYFDIANKRERVEIYRENVNRLSVQKNAVLTKLKLEEVPRTELLRIEAELSGARSELVQAENLLKYAYARLGRLLELPRTYDIIPPDPDDDFSITENIESFVDSAVCHRSDIKSLEMNVTLAEENVDIVKSEYWPTISFEAGYKYQDTDPSYLTEKETVYGAVNLNVVLFDWGFRGSTVSQEKANLRSAELQLQAKQKEIALEVEEAYLTVITAQSTIAALKDKLRFSKADYEATSLQFKVGQADSLDLIDSNTILLNSARELSEARFRLALAKIALERAQGIFLDSVKDRLNDQKTPQGDDEDETS